MPELMNKIIAIAVGGIIAAYLIPTAITAIVAVNTTTWGVSNIALWSLVSLFIILAVALLFIYAVTG